MTLLEDFLVVFTVNEAVLGACAYLGRGIPWLGIVFVWVVLAANTGCLGHALWLWCRRR